MTRKQREEAEERRRAEVHQGQIVWTLIVATGVAVMALYQLTLPKTHLPAGALTGMPMSPIRPTEPARSASRIPASSEEGVQYSN